MKIKNTYIKVIQEDITLLECEAIVNPANNTLQMEEGVAEAIKKRGGRSIEQEVISKGPANTGDAIWTKAGDLKTEYVIHIVTMEDNLTTDEKKIRQSCANALKCAGELQVKSVAFPALGCGVGNFPIVGAAKIMTQEMLNYLRANDTTLKEIIFCLDDKEIFKTFEKNIYGYIRHFTETLAWGPYVTVDIIIELPEGIVLIERLNPPYGWALPGGFVDYGESVENAAIREAKEETNLTLERLRQFGTYSDPHRDPRFHTVSTVFIAQGKGSPKSGDDAKTLKIVKKDDLLGLEYVFDHKQVIKDYLDSF